MLLATQANILGYSNTFRILYGVTGKLPGHFGKIRWDANHGMHDIGILAHINVCLHFEKSLLPHAIVAGAGAWLCQAMVADLMLDRLEGLPCAVH